MSLNPRQVMWFNKQKRLRFSRLRLLKPDAGHLLDKRKLLKMRKLLVPELPLAEESKNEMLKTPAISSSRRKAVETSSCRNVSSQLDECEEEADEEGVVDQKVEPTLMYTKRKVDAVKKETDVQKAYSTRRSTRVTEKKSAETRVKKDNGKAVEIDSFIDDEVNVESEENNVESGMEL